METSTERILLVENDPEISNLIALQALRPLGYQIQLVDNVNAALQHMAKGEPDLVMVDLTLPGLSGKDLLVAMDSQGFQIPVIVIAKKGQEQKVIQAFRLGGTDYLAWPVRETEVVATVERALKQVRERRSRQRLDQQLKEANEELQERVRELTTIFGVGRAVLSITDQHLLFEKIVEGMVFVAEADFGWLLVRDEPTKTFTLAAHRNLPVAWSRRMGQTLDDGICSLVAHSGETIAMNGEPLQKFRVASLGRSAVVVPVKVRKDVVGLLAVVRRRDQPFESSVLTLLEAVADYASISLVNARLFRALQEATLAAQDGKKERVEYVQALNREILERLQGVMGSFKELLAGKMGALTEDQVHTLQRTQSALEGILQLVRQQQVSQADAPVGRTSG
jgi:DNA-binding response OmpR family regulator